MKTLLKNGRIYDGTGAEPYIGSVLYEDDRIISVMPDIDPATADTVIDMTGQSVAPGFIDGHSHNDWFAIKNNPKKYFEPFIRQGMTTFVAGNCGISAIGFSDGTPHLDKVGAGLFHFDDTTGEYASFDDWAKAIDRNMPCNMAELTGHCSARASVSGSKPGKLTPAEEEQMLDLLERDLKHGAAGISLGMMYDPGLFADVEELKKVASLCVKYDRPLTVHPRAESKVSTCYPELFGRSHLLRALDELYEVAKGTNLKLQYSHAIFVGRKTYPDLDEFMEMIEKMRSEGIRVGYDIYDEVMGVSVITVIMPTWYQALSPEEREKPFNKLKFKAFVWATPKLLGFGFPDIMLAYGGEKLKKFEGRYVTEIAKEMGIKPSDAYLYLCRESDFSGRVNQGAYTTPELIKRQTNDPNCLFYMSDAWIEENGIQNLAVYDVFPKFIHDSILGMGDTLPRTIRKMSGATADRFQLKDRGYLKEGCFADITVFNEEEMKNGVPDQYRPFGIKRVIINGRTVLDGDKLDEEAIKTSGRVIRCS